MDGVFDMLNALFSGGVVEGLMFGVMVLGVFITFRVLDFPDLTVDGSFPLGASIMASMVTAGIDPWLALVVALLAGGLAGCITAAIHNYLKVPHLLSGILTMTMLWSVNIRIMGGSNNLFLLGKNTILSGLKQAGLSVGIMPDVSYFIFFLVFALVVKLLLDLFFHTDMGLAMGAMGNNPQMVVSSGVNPATLKFIGLGLSNGLVAVSGALAAQYQGFGDVSMGQGIVVAGLASVMIGEFLLRSSKIMLLTLRVLLGSIVFRIIMMLARYYGGDIGLNSNDQRLLQGLTIVILLTITVLRPRGRAKLRSTLAAVVPGLGRGSHKENGGQS